MFCLRVLIRSGAPPLQAHVGAPSLTLKGSVRPSAHETKPPKLNADHRYPSLCNVYGGSPDPKPCFDLSKVEIDRGSLCHAKMIRSFLYTHHWPREPSCLALWMSLHSPYLAELTEKYAFSGDRFVAFENQDRTNERKMIGLLIANKTLPWTADELETWGGSTCSKPDKTRMYFSAHCLRSPKLFAKYKVPYIYDVEVLVTSSDVCRQGVATLLLRTALDNARELRHPLVQLVSTSKYASTICSRVGMQREWSMDYSDFVDDAGQRLFFPRPPHYTVSVYVKTNPR